MAKAKGAARGGKAGKAATGKGGAASSVPRPPASATAGAGKAGGKIDPWLLNTRRLSEPVNAMAFNAAQQAEFFQKAPEDKKAQIQEHVAWLSWLGGAGAQDGERVPVPFESNDPIVLLAMGKIAIRADLRAQVRQALDDIDKAGEIALENAKKRKAG